MPFLDTWRSPLEFVLERAITRRGPEGSHRDGPRREVAKDNARGEMAGRGAVPGGLRDGSLDAASDRVLGQIERLEVAKARLEGRLVDAYAALHTLEEQQLARLTTRSPVPLSAEQVVTQEIACATGVGAGEVSRRLELALARRRHRVLRERLRAGGVSLYRALQVVAETRLLDEVVLPGLEAAVLAPAPDGSVASQRLFVTRLRRCVRGADPRAEDERACAAVRRRTAHGRLTEDGMGVFTVVATAERVVGVLDRADALARAARAAGDGRSLEQLRSDVLCDLALYGTVPPGALPAEGRSPRGATPVRSTPVRSTPLGSTPLGSAAFGSAAFGSAVAGPVTSGPVTDGSGTCGAPPVYARLLGQAPAAVVRIVVPFEVAAGLSDAACEIPGHGWVTAGHARRIMTAAGSVWQRLAVEVDSGRALELSSDRYAPTAAMIAHVRAVDGVCRAPGCQVPAERCDLDHLVPWPRGETRVSNFESLSRGCHNGKTAGVWTVDRAQDHGISWTSLAGREYITYPKDWREAVRDPGPDPRHTTPRGTPDDSPGDPPEHGAARVCTTRGEPSDDPPPF